MVSTVSTIHGFVLRECHQIPWAGGAQSLGEHEEESEPKSKSILLERIAQKHQQAQESAAGDVFVGPTTYIHFMHCFKYIFRDKQAEAKQRVEQLM